MTNKQKIEKIFKEITEEYGYTSWKLVWKFVSGYHGECSYKTRTILINEAYLYTESLSVIKDTLLHELAHMLTPGCNHNSTWEKTCKDLGGHPKATGSISSLSKLYETKFNKFAKVTKDKNFVFKTSNEKGRNSSLGIWVDVKSVNIPSVYLDICKEHPEMRLPWMKKEKPVAKKPVAKKSQKKEKIGEICVRMIKDGSYTHQEIIDEVLKAHPKAKTNVACLKWYESKIRNGKL